MNEKEKKRVAIALECPDANGIPKVAKAGEVYETPDGERVQIMHNGVKVLADRYYGDFHTEIIQHLKGHHEPQEEKIFHEVLKVVPPGANMIELGAFWSYYSLWFRTAVPEARNIMVEPGQNQISVGRRNFELNEFAGDFLNAKVGRQAVGDSQPPMICVDQLLSERGWDSLEILHSDIQGAEHDMLHGAVESLRQRKIRFVFVSTHGYRKHTRCLGFLRRMNYRILVEHTPEEGFSYDGLIVATADNDYRPRLSVSVRRVSLVHRIRGFFSRLQSRFIS
jgi:hypothetical protein